VDTTSVEAADDVVQRWRAVAPQLAEVVGAVLEHDVRRPAVEHGDVQPVQNAPFGEPQPIGGDAPVYEASPGQEAGGIEPLEM